MESEPLVLGELKKFLAKDADYRRLTELQAKVSHPHNQDFTQH